MDDVDGLMTRRVAENVFRLSVDFALISDGLSSSTFAVADLASSVIGLLVVGLRRRFGAETIIKNFKFHSFRF